MEVDHKGLKTLMHRCYKTKVSLDVKGATGIGKSWIAKEVAMDIAKEKGKIFVEWNELGDEEKRELLDPEKVAKSFLFVDIRLSQMDPSDLRGLPDLKGDFVEWRPNLCWKVASMKGADGIIFFDEMNLAAPSIQASAYQIINDHQISELAISKDILIISAGNRISDKANVYDEPAPLKNRRVNVVLNNPVMDEKSNSDWGSWASDQGVVPSIIGFLYWKPSYLYAFDAKNKDPSFPTPRMWMRTSQMIEGVTDMEQVRMFMGGCVSEGIAKEYVSFQKLKNKIDIRDLLKHPEKMAKITELDMKYSIVSGVAEMYKADQKILDSALNLCLFLQPEFSMFLLRCCKGFSKSNFASQLRNCPNWGKIAGEYAKYLM